MFNKDMLIGFLLGLVFWTVVGVILGELGVH